MKPLNIKSYGSIAHLSGSKMDKSDKRISYGQEYILTIKARDFKDIIIAQEKVDGSCCAVTLINNKIIPLTRSGYTAISSPYSQHIMFHNWVMANKKRFKKILNENERIVGEWMVQAHGTIYDLPHEPFIVFDYFINEHERLCYKEFLRDKVYCAELIPANLISYGMPISIENALNYIKISGHGAIDPAEGVVWRVERNNKVDFLAKYVRPDKIDGKYLPQISGNPEIWNKWI